ncbi:MAG: alpha/beta hydrolase [Candidatus Lokiarchaeota archaeon]|nr:alpha/beta hydrolase [Candidatus Lokiarchaeota archaeon]
MDKEDTEFSKKLFVLILLLALSLGYLYLTKSSSYQRYERVDFQSSGSTLYANLYYPSKDLTFQDNRPLVIFCHGIGSKMDFDLRIPIELTRRGFYVAALDYQGHGESGGSINDINLVTDVPALAEACSKLLDKLETMPFYSSVNISQIGLIGHSLGGMVVLMNQALDPRFNVTVAWAPLVNFDPNQLGIISPEYTEYIPVNLINESNTNNLLIIMHVDDEALSYEDQALKAQNLTNCEVISLSGFILGSPHQIFSDTALIDSINWFELKFFKSELINGPIHILYLFNYVSILFTLGLLFTIILLTISHAAQSFNIRADTKVDVSELETKEASKFKKIRQGTKIAIYTIVFIINWEVFELIFGIAGIFLASLNISLIYAFIAYRIYSKKLIREHRKFNFVGLLKSQIQPNKLIFGICCSAYFIGVYVLFSFSYPFAFMWPSNVLDIMLAVIIFPIYFSLEILYRKVIYPQLYFMNSERKKSYVIIGIATYVQINLITLTSSWAFFPSVMFAYLIFLIVIIQNTLIYEKTTCFTTVIFSSFTIIQLMFATVISNAFGIGAVLHLFVNL